jgi:transcriptional regulator with XRE-family HTH domain
LEDQELAVRHIALREQAGLTQEQEAKMAGVSPTTISGIESGKITRPHLRTLLKIARALSADIGELRDSGKVEAPPSQERLFNNGGLEDAAQSEALQESLAVLFRGLARRGQGIVEQSEREGPSEALSRELIAYHAETAALYRIKGGRNIFGRESDELAEAEAAYQEVEDRIQAMLRQDIDATEEERAVARRFKDTSKSYEIENHEADAS